MKKIALMMTAFIAAFAMTACNESDSDYATDVAYGNVTSTAPVTFMTDDNQMLVVADDSVVGNYTPDFGQRALIYYKRLQTANGTSSNQIKLFGYYHFSNGDSEIIVEGEDSSYGDVDIDIWRPEGAYYLVHSIKKVIDMAVTFPGTEAGIKNHTLTLVLDEEDPVDENNLLKLTLAHSTSDTEAQAKETIATLYTFDLTPFAFHIEGTDGVTITTPGIKSEKPVSHSFLWGK